MTRPALSSVRPPGPSFSAPSRSERSFGSSDLPPRHSSQQGARRQNSGVDARSPGTWRSHEFQSIREFPDYIPDFSKRRLLLSANENAINPASGGFAGGWVAPSQAAAQPGQPPQEVGYAQGSANSARHQSGHAVQKGHTSRHSATSVVSRCV